MKVSCGYGVLAEDSGECSGMKEDQPATDSEQGHCLVSHFSVSPHLFSAILRTLHNQKCSLKHCCAFFSPSSVWLQVETVQSHLLFV